MAAYLGRLATERGYSPHTIAGYRRELATLATLQRQSPAPAGGWDAVTDMSEGTTRSQPVGLETMLAR